MIPIIFNDESKHDDAKDVLLFWQKKIFRILFLILLGVGLIPYFLSCKYAVETAEFYRVIFYTIIYIWALGITFLERIPFKIRVWMGLIGFYFIIIFSMSTGGIIGSVHLYFICFTAFAAIFTGLNGGLIALFLNIITLALIGVLHFNNIFIFNNFHGISNLTEWFALWVIFSFLCTLVTFSLGLLIKAVDTTSKEFKLLIQNTTDIVWTLNGNLVITHTNPSVFTILGYKQNKILGINISTLVEQKQVENFINRIRKETQFSDEFQIAHENKSFIPVEINCSHIKNAGKTDSKYQIIIRDLTQRKAQEKEQERLKEKLVQAEKLKALGVLAGSVAHDLNNILSGIATYPEVLMMESDIDPKLRQGLTIIKDSGQKASDVVSDLLTISRGANAEMEVVNINSILERYMSALDFTKIRNTYPSVDIELMSEPELLNIRGSYIHVEKTIMNLVINAVEEVSEQETGNVLITTSNKYIDPSIPGYEDIPQGEYAVLSVIDNGSGIDKDSLKNIFQPFFTKKEMGKSGTGLGLTVVWNAVQDHKGFINIHSTRQGTTFDLLFPAIRQEVSKKTEPGTLDEIRGEGQIILIVDDLKNQQQIALSILKNLGYKAVAVDDGFKAVEFIKKNKVDLVILDMIMAPSISGLETYRMIKAINSGQRAIIASGYSASEDVQIAQDLGAGSFVKKPYTILDMGIAIKEELEK